MASGRRAVCEFVRLDPLNPFLPPIRCDVKNEVNDRSLLSLFPVRVIVSRGIARQSWEIASRFGSTRIGDHGV